MEKSREREGGGSDEDGYGGDWIWTCTAGLQVHDSAVTCSVSWDIPRVDFTGPSSFVKALLPLKIQMPRLI